MSMFSFSNCVADRASATRLQTCAWCLSLFMVTPLAFAQQTPRPDASNAMGLLQAYEAANLQDASLRSARAQADVVNERLVQAKAQLLPNVSFNASRFKNNLTRTQPNILGQETSSDDRYYSDSQTLQIRQPLYRPALGIGVDQARYQVDDAQAVLAR